MNREKIRRAGDTALTIYWIAGTAVSLAILIWAIFW